MTKLYFETLKEWVEAMEIQCKNVTVDKIYAGIDKKGYYLRLDCGNF